MILEKDDSGESDCIVKWVKNDIDEILKHMDYEHKTFEYMNDLEQFPNDWDSKIITMINYPWVWNKIVEINDKLLLETNRNTRMKNASMFYLIQYIYILKNKYLKE